ncbi:MAG: HAMP domain-containing sensor histidine kinase [Coleofasciculaceae cyanobacterium]
MVQKWLLPSLSEVLAQREQTGLKEWILPGFEQASFSENSQGSVTNRQLGERSVQHNSAATKAQREWKSAIASLEQLLLQFTPTSHSEADSIQGLVLASPVPVLSHPSLLPRFQTGIFTSEIFNTLALMPCHLPPGLHQQPEPAINTAHQLPLLPGDPLSAEQFCLVFSSNFSLVMVCGEDQGVPGFRFSFDPEDIQQAWLTLQPRLLLTSPSQLAQIESLVQKFAPQSPDYKIVMYFGRQLLKNLPELPQNETIHSIPPTLPINHPKPVQLPRDPFKTGRHWEPLGKEERTTKAWTPHEATPDVELLKALTHEIRTPLTTIRTLTKLLLKRQDLASEVVRRLEIIDHECTEQINRMELIFRAVELETTATKQVSVNLTSMSLDQLFQQSITRWQKQAQRRDLTLDIVLPQQLPTVVSNPAMLDQVLTGLMENFTRSLPPKSHIQVQVTPTGDQLKLQFYSQSDPEKTAKTTESCSTLKSIGQLLMFQPETGSLSLNLNVTKHLFQILGGKLIVRQRPQEGEVMTIFLPLEVTDTTSHQKEIFVK